MLALALLAATATSEPRLVWQGNAAAHLGAPSPDGRFLSCVDPATGDLAVRESDGAIRRVTRKATPKEFAYFSTISPDSRQIAYAWFNEEGYYDLRVVPAAGGEPKTLFRSEEAGFVQPSAWSPDGKLVLTLFFRKDNISQIALVPADGSPMRVLKSLNWVYPKKMDFSPDGKWIVYDNFARDGESQRDLFVLSAAGTKETRLVGSPGDDLFAVWSPAGDRVFFASDRDGTMDLWSVGVNDGAPVGEPQRLRRDLGRFLPMGMTRDGALYFGLRAGGGAMYVADWDGAAMSNPRPVGEGVSPAWSPDGSRLVWLGRAGAENFGQDARLLIVWDSLSGKARPVPVKLAHMESLAWTHDGKALLISGSDGKGRGGLFRVELESGKLAPVDAQAEAPFKGYLAADTKSGMWVAREGKIWRDGKVVYEAKGEVSALAAGEGMVAAIDKGSLRILDGGNVRAVGERTDWSGAAWSGDRLIAVAGDELWLISADGSESRRLARAAAPIGAVSAGARGIAFSAGKARSEIWVIDGLLSRR